MAYTFTGQPNDENQELGNVGGMWGATPPARTRAGAGLLGVTGWGGMAPGYYMSACFGIIVIIALAIPILVLVTRVNDKVTTKVVNSNYCPDWTNCTVGVWDSDHRGCKYLSKPEFTPCNGTCISPIAREWADFVQDIVGPGPDSPVCKHGDCVDLYNAPFCPLGFDIEPMGFCPWFRPSGFILLVSGSLFDLRLCIWGTCVYIISWPDVLIPEFPCIGVDHGRYELKLRASEICMSFISSHREPQKDCFAAYSTCVFGTPICIFTRKGDAGAYPFLSLAAAQTSAMEKVDGVTKDSIDTSVSLAQESADSTEKEEEKVVRHASEFTITQKTIDTANTLAKGRSLMEIIADEYQIWQEEQQQQQNSDGENPPPPNPSPEST